MAIDFPASPTNGQTFTSGSVTYTWDGTKWTAVAAAGSSNSISQGNTNATVTDTGSDGRFVVTTEGSERLRVTAAGLVGVGTASPDQALTVQGVLALRDSSGVGVGQLGSIGSTFRIQGQSGANLPLTLWTSDSERARIDTSGRLLVGTSSTSGFVDDGSKFYVRNSGQCVAIYNDTGSGWNVRHNATSNGGTFYFVSFAAAGTGVGGITSNTTTTTYGTTSDYRLKENIEPISDAVDRLKQLNPCKFNFIAAPERTVDGFLAHEVQAHVPEAVVGAKDAVDQNGEPVYQNIDQSKLVPLLTAALQEAIGEIESLKARVAALESA